MSIFSQLFNFGVMLSMAFDFHAHADNVYVSNYGAGTIEAFDSSGNGSIFASGLDDPTGLAFDGGGNLYVANSGNGTIVKFNSTGTESVFASGLNDPTGLGFDGSGNLYVANSGGGTIEKIDPGGNQSLFTSVSGLNEFTYLAFDGGDLYVSTTLTIEKFDSSGDESTILTCPNFVYGVAFDSTGNLFVSLQNAGSIVGLNGGRITFGNPFTAAPAGLAFDSNNNLYVALGGTIEKFNSFGGTAQIVPETNGFIFASGLDDAEYVAIQPAPEPSSWAMVVVGLGILVLGRLNRCSTTPAQK
jgi:DNA-binding beta-propeller fold protein YncE